jgi:hypothetical protein
MKPLKPKYILALFIIWTIVSTVILYNAYKDLKQIDKMPLFRFYNYNR